MKELLRPAVTIFVLLTLLTGGVYPLLVTLVAQGVFPYRANGSVIERPGKKPIGSELIGQRFDDPRYFWGRPSATEGEYNAASSSGSNLGPTNPKLLDDVKSRLEKIHNESGPVPVDLVTSSASGLDTHISPAAAAYQAQRVAKARGMTLDDVKRTIAVHTEERTVGLLGETRVNVLRLNLALDERR